MKPCSELNLDGRLCLEWDLCGGGCGPENVGKRMILRAAKSGNGGWQADSSLGIDQKHSKMFWSQWETVPILGQCSPHRLDDNAEIRRLPGTRAVRGIVLDAEARRRGEPRGEASFGIDSSPRRAGRSKPENAEPAEIIRLRSEAHAGVEGPITGGRARRRITATRFSSPTR